MSYLSWFIYEQKHGHKNWGVGHISYSKFFKVE